MGSTQSPRLHWMGQASNRSPACRILSKFAKCTKENPNKCMQGRIGLFPIENKYPKKISYLGQPVLKLINPVTTNIGEFQTNQPD